MTVLLLIGAFGLRRLLKAWPPRLRMPYEIALTITRVLTSIPLYRKML